MAVDWFGDFGAWTGFLRARGFALGVDDDLRVFALLNALRDCGIELPDSHAVARWIGPALCRNPDQQARLAKLLDDFTDLAESSKPAPAPIAADEVKQALRDNRIWLWVAIVVGGLVAMLLLLKATWPLVAGTSQTLPIGTAPAGGVAAAAGIFSPYFIGLLLQSALAPLPLFIAVVLVAGRHGRRAALLRGLAPRDLGRLGLDLRIVDLPLFRREALDTTLADLRRHRMVAGEGFDVPASVTATVASGGFITLVPARRAALPEHLLLCDLAGRDDHMGALADLLTARLRDSHIVVERFNFDGDPRRLRGVEYPGETIGRSPA